MKQKRLFRPVFAALLLLSGIPAAFGQAGGIASIAGMSADTSIVRVWRDTYTVIYSLDTAAGTSWIHLSADGAPQTSSVQIYDSVGDMEVLGDTLYYCGCDTAGRPVIGCLCLEDVATGAAVSLRKAHLPYAMPQRPMRMEVMAVPDGIHVFVVGDYPAASGHFRFLADVSHHYAGDHWELYYYPALNQIEFFDDIAVTENYVVTAAHKHEGPGIYMRMFRKPTNTQWNLAVARNSIFDTFQPTYQSIFHYRGDYDQIVSQTEDFPVYVVHTEGDSVAIACMAQKLSAMGFGFTVKSFEVDTLTGSWLVLDDWFYYQDVLHNSLRNVRDIRYDTAQGRLMVLHDVKPSPAGTLESVVSLFPLNALSTGAGYWSDIPQYFQSIDRFGQAASGAALSGKKLASTAVPLFRSVKLMSQTDCFSQLSHTPSVGLAKLMSFSMPINCWQGAMTTTVQIIGVGHYSIDSQCN